MRSVMMLCCAVVAIVFATSISRSDSGDSSADGSAASSTDEPITGQAVTPAPGSETPMRDPFGFFDIGGPEAAWSYETLTAEEKAIADRGRDVNGWDGINDAYRGAAMARAAQAAADAAALQLGVDNLGSTGVVP